MLGKNIDHAGNAAGIGVDGADGIGLKDEVAISAGDAESLADIAVGLFEREGSCLAADGDALAKLAELVTLERDFQLRLTREDDLQELLARFFEIEEKPDFLEGNGLQALSLVDNQDWSLTGAIPLKQPAIEGSEFFALLGRFAM